MLFVKMGKIEGSFVRRRYELIHRSPVGPPHGPPMHGSPVGVLCCPILVSHGWATHEPVMDLQCCSIRGEAIHASVMGHPFISNGSHMRFPWISHRILGVAIAVACEYPMDRPCGIPTLVMGQPSWVAHGFRLMGHAWVPDGAGLAHRSPMDRPHVSPDRWCSIADSYAIVYP